MKEKDISGLIERYEQMLVSGKNIYFDADEFDELAEYYDKLDDIETAKEIVTLGLSIHPDNEQLMLRNARFMIYEGDYNAVLEYLDAHFNTYNFELYMLRIESLLQTGQYTEAYRLTTEVLEDDDTEKEAALSELGFLYVEAEYFDEAILYFEKSLEYDPTNKDVLNDLAYAYEAKGNFEASIRTSEKILDLDPYAFDTWLTLGKLYSLNEDYEKAIDAFDFALTMDDTNINVYKLKIHCLIMSDRTADAVDVLKQAIEITPDDKLLYLTLVDCYLNLDKPDEILQLLDEFEARFGQTAESYAKRAYALFMKNNTGEAEKLVKDILKNNPGSADIYTIIANLYFRMGKVKEAEKLYKKILTFEDGYNEDVLNKLVVINLNQNDIKAAIDYQNKIIELTDTSTARVKMGLLYLEAGDKPEFRAYADSLDNSDLSALLSIFYPDEQINLSNIDRTYILNRLDDVFDSRLLYKNIKY